MGFLHDASIRTKVLLVVMAVTGVALLVATAALLIWDARQFKTDIGRELSAQARMVLENSTAAMSFNDSGAARETLETLSPNTHIQIACLYDASNALFAGLIGTGSTATCPERPPDGNLWFTADRAHVAVRTQLVGRPAGSIYLQSDLDAASERARVQEATAGVVLLVALVVAFLLSSVLQRIISQPIHALASTAREVATSNDYSLRAQGGAGAELGLLVDAFNGMLNHIEQAERERQDLFAREREANRLKDEFLMMLSHELRTPLNAIQGWTRMLLMHIVPADGIDKALQKIERNAHAQAKLIEDLVDIARLTTGKFRLERSDVDLVPIVQNATESILLDASARQITIVSRIDVPSAVVYGDPHRLQQVVANLLSNAVKFSPSDSSVLLAIRATDRQCELIVEDHGIGVDPSFLPLIFEPFRQADASSTRAHGGLGLGLSIVKRIIDLHSGDIRVESAGLGAGTTCTVRLPLVATALARASGSQTTPDEREQRSLDGLKVLVVDDDADSREILNLCLTQAGAIVRSAGSAADGLRLSKAFIPDVLVSDIAMPEQNGYTFLTTLKRTQTTPLPRLTIALTAHATVADRERALAVGFDRHVAKPFDAVALVRLIGELTATPGQVADASQSRPGTS